MPFIRDPNFIDPDFVPDEAVVADVAAAEGVGLDTAAVLTRRQSVEALAAAYRAKPGVDTDLCDLIDAMIAAGFDS